MIAKPLVVKALDNCTIWLRFSDGTEGTADLSPLSEKGIFKVIKNPEFFNQVYIDKDSYAIAWSPILELCPDSLYLRLRGLTFEEWRETKLHHATN
ncbi:MAG: DUF2442 domain-containing protein [Bacteroidetes bacterium]|nr:DUF2442 domain-containing protein [Bacteroidota bacterium]